VYYDAPILLFARKSDRVPATAQKQPFRLGFLQKRIGCSKIKIDSR